MRIGLNMLYLRPGLVGGTETYARGLIDGLHQVPSAHEFVFFLNESAYPTFAGVEDDPRFERVLCRSPLHPAGRHLWEQLHFGRLCKKHRIDLLHSLGNIVPVYVPAKQIVTIHDVIFIRKNLKWLRKMFMRLMIPIAAQASELVLTVSEFSRRDIIEKLHVREDRVLVTLEGPGQDWGEYTSFEAVQQKYGLPANYFLTVGTGMHKRIEIAEGAIRRLRSQGMDAHLVVAGYHFGNLDGLAAQHAVTLVGYVPPADLAALFRNATALVCASELEGFGLPVVEAMTLGTPVISVDRGSLAEVMGEGGLLVKQEDSESLAQAMMRVSKEPELREQLRRRGAERAAQFSWRHCAESTLRAYDQILGNA